jgi:hypothetical protein
MIPELARICRTVSSRKWKREPRHEGVELVGGMHRFALHVLGEADFRRVRAVIEDMARNIRVSLDGSGFGEGFERQEPASSGNYGVFCRVCPEGRSFLCLSCGSNCRRIVHHENCSGCTFVRT